MQSMRYSRLVCLLALCAFGQCALAQTTVPHIFTPGTPARATEVNANFQALATAIDNVIARVAKLEGGAVTEADVVGNYQLSFLQVGISQVAVGVGEVEAISYDGTFTFAADHTFTSTFIGRANDSRGPHTDDGTLTGTWSLANNNVTFTVSGQSPKVLHCAAGCRVLFGTIWGSSSGPGDDGYNNLAILGRLN
jgi:hypothetical protein